MQDEFHIVDIQPAFSLSSSRSNSISSRCSAYYSPESSVTSPQAEVDNSQGFQDFPVPQYTGPLRRDSLDVGALGSFGCLVVCLDAHAERLLYQYKLAHV